VDVGVPQSPVGARWCIGSLIVPLRQLSSTLTSASSGGIWPATEVSWPSVHRWIPILLLSTSIPLFTAVGVLAATNPLSIVRLAAGLAAAAILVAHPYFLVVVWSAAAAFGDIALPGGQSLFGALSQVSLPCLLLALARDLPRVAKRQPWIVAWAGFVLVVLFNIPRAQIDTLEALKLSTGYFDSLALAIVIMTRVRTAQQARYLLWITIATACVIALIACYQFASRSGGADVGLGVYRVFGVFNWANTLGFYLICPQGIASYLLVTSPSLRGRLGAGLAVLILTSGLFFTFGRAAWIGGMLAVAGPVVLGSAARRAVVPVSILVAAPLVLVSTLGLDLSHRLGDTADYAGREMIWQVVLNRALQSPVFGYGFNADGVLMTTTPDMLVAQGVHNIYLVVLYNYGIVGLLPFVCTWLAFAWQAALRLRGSNRDERCLLIAALSVLAGVLAYSHTGLELFAFGASTYVWILLAVASTTWQHKSRAQ
jgi:O-antigen ligase